MVKKNTSFNLDEDLLTEIKIKAVKKKTTQTKLVEEYLMKGLKEDKSD